ncbi:protein FAM151B isoform X2 [Euwallacea fornicatus]|uniref:protein FAM151B isoform X2 n=1 Tax=Euwallacea fornicatus TaxID=995702 RepID=UPI00338EDC15
MFFLSLLFLLLAFGSSIMSNGLGIEDFFPDAKQNLTKITWAHAVNNRNYLNTTLKDDDINMIEADVIMGTLKSENSKNLLPVMGHPPENVSDLSLQMFLDQVKAFNLNVTVANNTRKGVKLDFKSTDAFNSSIQIVTTFDKENFPIWINADILPGPIDAGEPTVDAKNFFKGANLFPNSILSIGWTTQYNDSNTGGYKSSQISDMVDVIKNNKISQNITFPVRAGLAAQSIDLLVNLTEQVPNSTLTIWSSLEDNVDTEKLRLLIKKNGLNKTFIDVPRELLEKLHLNDLPNGGSPLRNPIWFIALVMLILNFGIN